MVIGLCFRFIWMGDKENEKESLVRKKFNEIVISCNV